MDDLILNPDDEYKITYSIGFQGQLEIETEFPDYGCWTGIRTGEMYAYLSREEATKLRDWLGAWLASSD